MIYAIVVVLVLILDQAVKLWVTGNIPLNATGDACVSLIPGVVHLTDYHNNGAAFSIFQDSRWLLVGITVVFIIVIIVLINREIIRAPFGKWMAMLVLAGAIGNCIDRVLFGYVVDMFEVEFMNFAIFNVADIFITVCGLLFCVHIIVYREPKSTVPAAVREAQSAPEMPAVPDMPEIASAPMDKTEQLLRAFRAANNTTGSDSNRDAAVEMPSYDFGAVAEAVSPMPAPRPAPQPAPVPERQDSRRENMPAEESAPVEAPAAPVDEFSLEAIMKEFGSF